MIFLKVDVLWKTTTTKTKKVKDFKLKYKVWKNSLHGQIWSDFEKVCPKM
jgi:AAA+ superfamily predicted ATPase